HLILDVIGESAFLERRKFPHILGCDGLGVVASHFREPFSLARPRYQILGLLLGSSGSGGVLAVGGDKYLAQEQALLAHKFGLVLVVIFFDLVVLNVDPLADFLANDTLPQH